MSIRDEQRVALYLEDLTVGRRFATGTAEVTDEEMTRFASRYDPQPFHLSDEGARGSLFGRRAASGWLTAAVTMRLQVEGGPPIAGGLIGAGGRIDWPRPTYAGDVLRVESEVVEVRPSRSRPGTGLVTLRSVTLNQRDEAAQIFTCTLVVPRRPAD
ncbi:MAG: MaoC family dehydratase [Thermoleophilia bacterium]